MKLILSTHALDRYLERVLELSRAKIADTVARAIGTTKDGRYRLPGTDIIAVIENKTILSFVPDRPPPIKRQKKSYRPTKPSGELWPDDE